MTKKFHHTKPPSPTNIAAFPSKGWASKENPIMATVSGCNGTIIGYDDYYFHNEQILCTRAFSISAVATTINDGEFPPGSTELDDKTGHNCKMPRALYNTFCIRVLGLPQGSHTIHRSEKTFRNMLLHDIDALLHYYSVNYFTGSSSNNPEPISLPGDRSDMARILARFTLLLVGTNACTPHIIQSVWGSDDETRMALGGPRGDLSLIRRRLLTLSKIAINTIYIWMTDPDTPIFAADSPTFRLLPPTFKQLLIQTHDKIVYARQPILSGEESTVMLTNNLRAHIHPDNSLFEEKAIQWYKDLLLNQEEELDDTIGFENGILIAYGMTPPCELMVPREELTLICSNASTPTYFMRCPSTDIWGTADC
jgi:hypothetical protein